MEGRFHIHINVKQTVSSAYIFAASESTSTVGARAFPVSGPTVWHSLPADVAAVNNLPGFRRRLKFFPPFISERRSI